ncbi:MAG: hypothetical protein VYD87_12285 [Pseudomonadota bacterium]|nr:hypothetical protein [Pseudomonadota bacterium]
MRFARSARRRLMVLSLTGLAAAAAALPDAARACDAGEVRALIGRGFTDAEIDRHCAASEAQALAEALGAAIAATPPPAGETPEPPPAGAAACPPPVLRGDWVAELRPEAQGDGPVTNAVTNRLASREARALWRIGEAAGAPTLARAARRWPLQPEPVPLRLAEARCEAGMMTLVWDEQAGTGPRRMVVRLAEPAAPGGLGGALSGAAPAEGAAGADAPGVPQAEAAPDLVWGEYLRETRAGAAGAGSREFGRVRLERATPPPVPAPVGPVAPAPAAAVPPVAEEAGRPAPSRLPSIAPPPAPGSAGLAALPGLGAPMAMTPAAARERLAQLRAARDMCRSSMAQVARKGLGDMCGAFDATIADLERIAGL